MKILFVDQSGNLGGAELCLADIAAAFKSDCLVALLQTGPFQALLASLDIPVRALADQGLKVRKDSGWAEGIASFNHLLPLVAKTAHLATKYDLIYANTPKALMVAALASQISRRPLVYHLHDIISEQHFSRTNRRLLVFLANRFAALIIANSVASQQAFIQAGGNSQRVRVVYNGFRLDGYALAPPAAPAADQGRQLPAWAHGLEHKFVVGHFSRLSPWKGQDVLIQALTHCPEEVVVLLVGDALFGEDEYVAQLHHLVHRLKLEHRVHFLGFRSDVASLMHTCDLVAHTSTAPEPFGRVIVEAMLCGKPVIAAAAGGAVELVDHGKTGWLCPPKDTQKLAELITLAYRQPDLAQGLARAGQAYAQGHFSLATTNQQILALLEATYAAIAV